MSLVRLLTAGKSLIGFGTTTSRYHVRAAHQLPKFGSRKNPFAASTAAANDTPPAVQPEAAPGKAEAPSPQRAFTRPKETKRAAVVSPASAKTVTLSKPRRPVRAWFAELNPLSWWPARRRVVVSSSGSAGVAIQGELSLDNVKVVRNDLSDVDVEIVPAKAVVAKPAVALPAAESKSEPVAELFRS